jgi:hypothetical protein
MILHYYAPCIIEVREVREAYARAVGFSSGYSSDLLRFLPEGVCKRPSSAQAVGFSSVSSDLLRFLREGVCERRLPSICPGSSSKSSPNYVLADAKGWTGYNYLQYTLSL